MSEQESNKAGSDGYGGDRRSDDRRSSDRRQGGRRAPLPPWRRPAAYVAYGVVAALALFLIFGGNDEPDPVTTAFPEEQPRPDPSVLAMEAEPADVQAYSVAQFERLVAEGEAAVGQLVDAELYCSTINPISLRDMDEADPRLVELADTEGRVPGSECRWSREARSDDFLLIVPSQLAEQFARAPQVELNFVQRRQVPATLLWLGRSESLSVRIAGILTGLRAQ